jgi:hypothetical protein
MGYLPDRMLAPQRASGQLHRVTGAQPISISSTALYQPDNPNRLHVTNNSHQFDKINSFY